MSDPEVEDVCDTFWDGNNGEELADKRACAGCHYLLGAMALGGLMGMAQAIRTRRWKCPTCRCSPSILTSTCSCCAEPEWALEDDERAF